MVDARELEREGRAPRVLVIGGGVSGCACAATLARSGVAVRVLSEALDSVGLPRLGPILRGAGGGASITVVMEELPGGLREAWMSAASVPVGTGFAIVDRRMVSVETKRRLEEMQGVEFRQGRASYVGLAKDERTCGPGYGRGVAVKTVFGEVLEAEAAVVAVGWGLGEETGREDGGSARQEKGVRGGLGLKEALERLGVEFERVCVDVGLRVGEGTGDRGSGGEISHRVSCGVVGRRKGGFVETVAVERVIGDGRGTWATGNRERARLQGPAGEMSWWPKDWPESPHWTEELWPKEALVWRDRGGGVNPLVSPDGVATGEWYVGMELEREESPGGEVGLEGGSEWAAITRTGGASWYLAASNVADGGRVRAKGLGWTMLWVTGQAGGARGYLESLSAGVKTGEAVADALRGGVLGAGA